MGTIERSYRITGGNYFDMLTQIIKDPNNLGITTKVNGKTVQNSSTKDMIFNVKQIINFISQGTTLLPGDVIMTGTPEGISLTILNTSQALEWAENRNYGSNTATQSK